MWYKARMSEQSRPSPPALANDIHQQLMEAAAACTNWQFETEDDGFLVGSHGDWRFFLIIDREMHYGRAVRSKSPIEVHMQTESIQNIFAEARKVVRLN
jgi:hypothetical protein